MKYGLSSLLLFAVTQCAWAGFEGHYKCHGNDPYLGKDYTGTITVTPQNAVYQLVMDYDTGEHAFGTGGEYDKTIMFVVFQDQTDKTKIGLEQYQFSDDDNKIAGYWVYLGKDKLGREICDKVKDAVPASLAVPATAPATAPASAAAPAPAEKK
jgi:hypothetical protein